MFFKHAKTQKIQFHSHCLGKLWDNRYMQNKKVNSDRGKIRQNQSQVSRNEVATQRSIEETSKRIL